MMKGAGIVALLAASASAALEDCLYCRYTDLHATFLESWSYCAYQQECLADQWNYIDRACPESGWVRGKTSSLDFCEAEMAACPEFVSSLQYDLNEPLGAERNISWTLPSGAMCEVTVDATEYVGRVLFDDVQGFLGIDGYNPDYDMKEKISFQGEVGKVLIYNAARTGSLRFTISFSGATESIKAAALGVLAISTLAWF